LYDKEDLKGEKGDEEAKKQKFRLIGPLSQLHNIIIYIRGSIAQVKEFRALASRIIPLNNRTR
jgi:hypothetical protein